MLRRMGLRIIHFDDPAQHCLEADAVDVDDLAGRRSAVSLKRRAISPLPPFFKGGDIALDGDLSAAEIADEFLPGRNSA